MEKSYKLSDVVIPGDKLSENITKGKSYLYEIIKNFSSSNDNNGFLAEEIIRVAFNTVNLNNLYRNHPTVDIGIIDAIEGIVEEREIISIKSSIKSKTNPLAILKDSKSIKIESLLAYIVYANSNFELSYQNKHFKLDLLRKGLDMCFVYGPLFKEIDYKKMMNITLYYLIIKNDASQDSNYKNDIKSLMLGDDNLSNGNYEIYKNEVLKKLINLNSPISLGTINTVTSNDNPNDIICIFNKTNTIKLNRFWLRILDIWCTNKYFNVRNAKGIVEKYLTGGDIKNLFGIENSEFPIQIKIGTGDYKTEDISVDDIKYKSDDKLKRFQTFNKFIDSDFGRYNDKIVRTFNYMINDLREDPKRILKYQMFIKK